MYEIKLGSLYVRCPAFHDQIRTVYFRTMQTPDGILADSNGCEHCSGDPRCAECIRSVSKRIMSGEDLTHAPYSSQVTPADLRAASKKP